MSLVTVLILSILPTLLPITGTYAQPAATPVTVTISITTTGAPNRFFAISGGDTLVQVAHPLYLASSSTQAMFTTGDDFTGSATGTLSGSINGRFNTIWVDITTTSMRGLSSGHASYTDASGTMEFLMAFDVEATLSGGNIAAASLKGYGFSKASTGIYNGKLLFLTLEGSLTEANTYQLNGEGYLFSGCEDISFSVSASRGQNPGENRGFLLQNGDKVVQYEYTDITIDAANTNVYLVTLQKLVGTASGGLAGSFTLDSNAIIISSGTYAGRGYSVARFSFTSPDGTLDGFLLLDNINYGQHKGYMAAHSGTGVFHNKYFIGSFDGTFYNPPNYYDYKGSGTLKGCRVPPPPPPPKVMPPVGGEVYSSDKLAILAPYIALIGLASVVAVAVKRRKT
ncbi:hypothetical protein KEJ44_03085 [Candidatus Bathyarchaeota archaeon]|nr:hypothetical protein [Candidatus Bathyarchaeota archaeon]